MNEGVELDGMTETEVANLAVVAETIVGKGEDEDQEGEGEKEKEGERRRREEQYEWRGG